jgi:hypothetical protein
VFSIALPNFEELLLKKNSSSKVYLEKFCNKQELHKDFLLQTYFLKIKISYVFNDFCKKSSFGGLLMPHPLANRV